jgi:hypothetical protein
MTGLLVVTLHWSSLWWAAGIAMTVVTITGALIRRYSV